MNFFLTVVAAMSALICLSILAVYYFRSNYGYPNTEKMENLKRTDFTVVQINPDVDNLSESFGITDERMDYLIKRSNEIARKHAEKVEKGAFLNVAAILEEVSKECVHQNELAIVSLQIGGSISRFQESRSGQDFLRNLLDGLENQ